MRTPTIEAVHDYLMPARVLARCIAQRDDGITVYEARSDWRARWTLARLAGCEIPGSMLSRLTLRQVQVEECDERACFIYTLHCVPMVEIVVSY